MHLCEYSNMLRYTAFTIFLSSYVQGQVPFFGTCPHVTTTPNFQIEKYLGKWYEAERYFAIFEFGGKCVTAYYGIGMNGTVNVINQQISALTGIQSTIDGKAKPIGNLDEAKLSVNFPSLPVNFDAPYWVVDTDYVNYAVVWSCNDFGILNTRNAWILTRERNHSLDVMKKAYAALDKQNISRAYFIPTDQKNCPRIN